jgi:hypothetical protein
MYTTLPLPIDSYPTAFDRIEATPVDIEALLNILQLRRDANSDAEQMLIDTYIKPLDPVEDLYGNLFVTVGDLPAAAFTAHTDTVHSNRKGDKRERQALRFNTARTLVMTEPEEDCLGADDGTGVWVLLNMIEAGVPGLYCFFRDEESGRGGSDWSAKKEPDRYAGITMMLSFDRKGITDVITHQMGSRCCSEVFAEHISKAINDQCAPDDTGSFTDSYSFTHLIPECTNICVGYYAQHTGMERQDLTWAAYLVNQLIAINWSIVPVERDPLKSKYAGDYTMLEIVELFPEEVAGMLEDYMGLTTNDMVEAIADINNLTPQTVTDELDHAYELSADYLDSWDWDKDFRL